MQVRNLLLSRCAALVAAGVCTVVLSAGMPLRSEAKPSPASVKIGTPVAAKTFRDIQGKTYTLRRSGTPAVYLFLGTQCPVANLYTPRILALKKAPSARNTAFFAVYPNAHETTAEVARHAKERGYEFSVIKDDGTLTAALGATMTPEAVLVDGQGVVRYRGRIDDNRDAAKVTTHDLKNALEAVSSGQKVARTEAPAFGCTILTAEPAATTPRLAKVTYARDVAPILQKNCLVCHRSGEVAPFAVETYAQAKIWAKQIKAYTSDRKMPPWKADSHGEFRDERRLTEKEIATLATWADVGAPAGDLKQTPKPPKFPTGWQLGKPDLVVEMPETYDVPAEGRDIYRCFIIPTNYDTDRWVSGVEVKPGNNAVVHHVIAYLDKSGVARKLDAADPGPGYTNPTPGNSPGILPVGLLAGWAPGNAPGLMPAGLGLMLPKGADIVLEVHYHMNGKPEKDRTKLGVHFAKAPVEKALHTLGVITLDIKIPAGEANHAVRADQIVYLPDGVQPKFRLSKDVSEDITVLGVTPHMHLVGRAMKVKAIFPDKSEKILVDVPDWDFNWQISYDFKQPVKLSKGTRLEIEARYDNSSSNPNNPNKPPKEVRYGEQSADEMCVAFLRYTQDNERLTQKLSTEKVSSSK
jgi:hypothetical protein